ncbi:MAG: T9SS type A sorting domain-containing protein [Chitinophagales bacterium]
MPGRILLSSVAIFFCATAYAQTIKTIAGNGTTGYTGNGGQATFCEMNNPNCVFSDGSGDIYIADENNNCIRKISNTGVITTIAGNGTAGYSGDGGQAIAAMLNQPTGVVKDAAGNLYIADMMNDVIRKVNTSGIITTFAGNGIAGYCSANEGGQATDARIWMPAGVAVDRLGNVYIAEEGNSIIQKVNTSGIINTVAGVFYFPSGLYSGDGGPAVTARLNQPTGVFLDTAGNMYIADNGNNCIRKVNTSGYISTIAGVDTAGYSGDGGTATSAKLNLPSSVCADATGNIYIADNGNHRIRKISTMGIITTIAGTGIAGYGGDGGCATAAQLNFPTSVYVDTSKNIYIADAGNSRIRKIINSNLSVPDLPDFVNINIYPNPTIGQLVIEHSGIGTAVRIFNILGQNIYTGIIQSDKETISLSNYQQGTYLLQTTDIYGNRTIKTVVKQ